MVFVLLADTKIKKNIDWKKKEFEFRKLLDKYRSRNGSYDIVIPGSGGKDSFKVAHELKYRYDESYHLYFCTMYLY